MSCLIWISAGGGGIGEGLIMSCLIWIYAVRGQGGGAYELPYLDLCCLQIQLFSVLVPERLSKGIDSVVCLIFHFWHFIW